MSCLGPYYLPVPPRRWSRVENLCAYANSEGIQNIPGDYIYLPYIREPILKSQYEYQLACLRKGNVLQYKKNSSNLTKKQVYGQIAKQMWVNRNTTWATQSDKFTDPNIKSLKRVNYYNVTTTGVPTAAPLTCSLPLPLPQINIALPTRNSSNSSSTNAPIIPVQQNSGTNSSIVMPSVVPSEPNVEPIVIADSGSLVCNVVENICNKEILAVTANQQCFLTTASDVPGRPILLCYNDALPTVYPKTRLTYPPAGGKWPEGAKFIVAANTTKPIKTFNVINENAINENAINENAINENKNQGSTLDDFNIYTINSRGTKDYTINHPGVYIIYKFNGLNINLPFSEINLGLYSFFNLSGKNVNIRSEKKFINEFYAQVGENNLTLTMNRSCTITSVIRDDLDNRAYFADYNVIQTQPQNTRITPIITYINNTTTNESYPISNDISDCYVINSYTSSGNILLPDSATNFTIVKIFNLSESAVTLSSSNAIYNAYYALNGVSSYIFNQNSWASFQLVKSETRNIWIMNYNNNNINNTYILGPYYIKNQTGDFLTSENSIYIIESINGDVIIPSSVKNLSNIRLFNISGQSVNVKTLNGSTLMYNDFFCPPAIGGITMYSLSSNSAISFEFVNFAINNLAINPPFWTFTIS
jgi:hypothetical protein